MGGLIPEDIIDEISTRADIVEVVQKYVPLQRAGSRWKACCPFHQEKTPSFVVNPASNSCYCFGCGKGGSVFKFIMEMENLSFPEAARMLARWYNVMIPEPERITFRNGEKATTKENYNIRERLYLLHEKLASWYMGNLKNARNAKVNSYFAARNMREESAKQFMIGASLDEWDGMMKWAEQEKFTLDELKLAHLVSESSKTPGKYFDFFRNRLMFPIWDEQGRVVGFSARQIDPAQGGGKYVNSMESPIFKKSKLLYGLNFARKSIGEKKYAVICEGQMDVIAMHTAGVTNAIAPQGTAFGEDQAKIIKRCFFDGNMQITLATDADSAGIKAAIRDAEILLPMGANLKVAAFPGGKDPDELLKNSGAQAVVDAVENARDFFEFLYDSFTGSIPPSTPAEKTQIAEKILKYIRLMDSEIARDSYIQWLGDKVGLSPGTIRSEMSRQNILQQANARKYPARNYDDGTGSGQKENAAKTAGKELPDSETDPRLHQAFAQLLKVLLKSKKSTEKAAAELPAEVMDQGPLAVAVETVIEAQINGEWEMAPALITKKMTCSSLESKDLDEILAQAGEEEKIPAVKNAPPEKGQQTEMTRQEALRNERAEAKLRALGLPTADQARNSMEIANERKRRREIDKKTVEDCILVIKRHFLTKKTRSLKEKVLKTPPGKERNELLIESVLLTRELMKLNNPDFAGNLPAPVLPRQRSMLEEETGKENMPEENPEENISAVPVNPPPAVPFTEQEGEEDAYEAYREIPPEDYLEEEPFVEEGMEEEIIELPDILQ